MQKYFFTIALSVLLIGVSCTESTVRGPAGTIVDDDDFIPLPPV